jgi:hypothetical protein
LLNSARELLTQRVELGLGLLGVFEEPYRLLARLHWLEKPSWHWRKLARATSVSVGLLLALLVLPMGRPASEGALAAETTASGSAEGSSSTAGSPAEELRLITTEPLYAAVLPMQGDPKNLLEAGKARLDILLRDAGVETTGPVFARLFFGDPNNPPEGGTLWEIGYPVAPGTKVPPPLEIVQASTFQMASMSVEGTPDPTPHWSEFVGRIAEAGYRPFPPAVQVWTGKKIFWRETELRVPVMGADATYPGMEVSFSDRPAFTALTLPMHGSYSQFEQAVTRLDEYVQGEGLQVTGDLFGLFWSDAGAIPRSEFEWVLGYPVPSGTQATAPFRIQEFAAARVSSATFEAGRNVEYPWPAVIMKTVLSGNVPAGPPRVTWHSESGLDTTEIAIPVLPAGGNQPPPAP